MEDDQEDIEMKIDSIPSQVHEVPYLFYPSQLPDAHGKWLLFAPKGSIHDQLWENIKLFFQSTPAFCLFAKTSTSRPHSHQSSDGYGVVMVYCENNPESIILRVGQHLANMLQYTSKTGKLYYKTEQQSRTKTNFFTAYEKKHTFAIDVPRDNIPQKSLQLTTAPPKNKICVYSLNVWMNHMFIKERMLAIFQDIESRRPDILMFQEVTVHSYSVLNDLLRSIGFSTRSQLKPDTKKFSEMLYFNTRTMEALDFEQLNLEPEATMKRECHVLRALHKVSQKRMVFATAHLETGKDRKELRERQFRHLQFVLEQKQLPWIFGGDTNMGHDQDYLGLAPQTHDAWEQTGCEDRYFGTWDPCKNTNLQKMMCGKFRFDRFLFQKSSLVALDFQLSCQTPIPLCNNSHPSDHFAIVSNFIFSMSLH